MKSDTQGSPSNVNNKKSINIEKGSVKSIKATEAKSSKMEMMKSTNVLSEKNPSMSQKLDILQTWFVSKA